MAVRGVLKWISMLEGPANCLDTKNIRPFNGVMVFYPNVSSNCSMTNCCSISTWVNKEDGVCQTRSL